MDAQQHSVTFFVIFPHEWRIFLFLTISMAFGRLAVTLNEYARRASRILPTTGFAF
jgi:hypothetical protein